MTVAIKRATFIAGARKEVGDVVSLAFSLGSELIHAGKAERVADKALEPAPKVEPAKFAASKAKE